MRRILLIVTVTVLLAGCGPHKVAEVNFERQIKQIDDIGKGIDRLRANIENLQQENIRLNRENRNLAQLVKDCEDKEARRRRHARERARIRRALDVLHLKERRL